MIRLLIAALLWLLPAVALAQNPQCPTRPNGDSGNACASTAFVQNAFGGGSTLALTNNNIFIGNGSNLATQVLISGDCTTSNLGVITCTKTNGVSFASSATTDTTNAANISSGTLPTGRLSGSYTGITGVGTLTVGTWNATPITNANLANMAANTAKCNNTGSSAAPTDCTTVNLGSAGGSAGQIGLNGSTSGSAIITATATGGHTTWAGSGAAPTLTAGCNGAGSAISGTDLSGTVFGQTAAATTCTVTFGTIWTTVPRCQPTGQTAAITTYTPSTTTLVITFPSTASFHWDWRCDQ